ncbi:MAG: NAD-dependent epimerase [Candidatus Cyclobacteriaceae bacterium M3_2C_046]
MKVLVTGTAGFIGMHTALKLLDLGHEVVGLDNINDYYDTRLKYSRLNEQGIDIEKISYNKLLRGKASLSFIQLHLEDRENLGKLFEQESFDYVINLAAQAGVRYSLKNPFTYVDSNIAGFLSILESCRYHNIKHLIYASSSSVYGLNTKIPFEESNATEHPVSLYATSKKTNELMAHTYSHLFNIPTTGLRFFTVYGPWGRPDMALFIFTKSILEDKPIEVFNQGDMFRDFTYIDDIVNGIVGLMTHIPVPSPQFDASQPVTSESSAPYRIYNIGNSSPVNLMDFVRALEDKLQKKANIDYQPIQPGDVKTTYADTSALEKAIGYKPNTPIKLGISRFVDWYTEFNKI